MAYHQSVLPLVAELRQDRSTSLRAQPQIKNPAAEKKFSASKIGEKSANIYLYQIDSNSYLITK